MKATEEFDITVGDYENVTSRTLVNYLRYTYDSEGNLVARYAPLVQNNEYYQSPEDGEQILTFYADVQQVTSHSKTDSFGRKMFDELQLGTGFVSRRCDYVVGDVTDEHKTEKKLKSSPTTNLVSRITYADGRTIEYEYDKEERITKVIDSVDGTTEYTYDALGQLLTETVNGVVVNTMTYDNYGNILTKNGVTYGYDSTWKDLLTSYNGQAITYNGQAITYNGQAITYDEQGNPTNYLGYELEWEKGRQLKKLTKPDGTAITYTYNANGIRTSKTVGSVKHTYVLDGTKILSETYGDSTLYAHYDNEGSICGITYDHQGYFFVKNQQGDIIAITDKDGGVVARYRYDAWGKVVSILDADGVDISTNAAHIANINPFRYRGYYYDTETGLYYLQSRYYDPETGRFINADECFMILFKQSEILSNNIYSYCENSSVNKVDHRGFSSTTYGSISCSKTKKGFNVKMHFKFLVKVFCKKYAKHVISNWGSSNKYNGMNAIRIAMELFGHAVLYVLGIVFAGYAILNLVYAWTAKIYLSKIIGIINAAISGCVAKHLIDRTKQITVNNDEVWYRLAAYGVIWNFFPPIVF